MAENPGGAAPPQPTPPISTNENGAARDLYGLEGIHVHRERSRPSDHPHEFIDMGGADEAICPYCSTLYRYKPELGPGKVEPAECLWDGSSTTPDKLLKRAARAETGITHVPE